MPSGKDSLRDSPLYRSLQELLGRYARDVRRGLEQIDALALGDRATAAALGRSDGWAVIWALTPQRLVIASTSPDRIPTVCESVSAVRGVHFDGKPGGSGHLDAVAAGRHHHLTAPSGALEPFATALAAAIGQHEPLHQAVLGRHGVAALAGDPLVLAVSYVGGPGEPLPAGPLRLIADDLGLHVCAPVRPVEYAFVAWGDVESVSVQPVRSGTRLTVTNADGELVLASRLPADQLRGELSRFPAARDRSADPVAIADALTRLAELHRTGALDDEEFAQAKRRILASGEPAR